MWTGAILSEVIAQRFEVQLKDSRIYELLEELGLSISAPIAIANAIHKQHKRVETVKKLQSPQPGERTVFFLNTVYDRPSLFYGWAERNTVPKSRVMNKRNKLNGLLCVDALSGEEFFRLSPGSKRGCVWYLAELCFVWSWLHQTLHHSRQ